MTGEDRLLNARLHHDAAVSGDGELMLVHVTHGDLDEPVRLSTDPTQILGEEPRVYGTMSAWPDGTLATAHGTKAVRNAYPFVIMRAPPPDDQDDTLPATQIYLDPLDAALAEALRATRDQATVALGVFAISDPDRPVREWRHLRLVVADGDAGEIALTLSYDPLMNEQWPHRRMTRSVFPALHR